LPQCISLSPSPNTAMIKPTRSGSLFIYAAHVDEEGLQSSCSLHPALEPTRKGLAK
jgi:hypothetical protein